MHPGFLPPKERLKMAKKLAIMAVVLIIVALVRHYFGLSGHTRYTGM